MVTKLAVKRANNIVSSVLAKIHMVTKLYEADIVKEKCSVLAKIHMVTKRPKHLIHNN